MEEESKKKEVDKTFARQLKKIMDERGMTQKWLSDRAGVNAPTVSRYLGGKNLPEVHIIMALAKALNVTVDYLCGLTDTERKPESLGSEQALLLKCYERADAQDKKTLWTLLGRYMTAEEKRFPFSSSVNSEAV
ncbi:MAG: helix-turn-helix domain-containing protein [Oscillospiraceae bacterium]|jgi:transcriptional regulator with XRE-family HTH domain|nr:helix-turn-helix domain-containing protein [Oscillospiraceae bacterium]